MNQESAKTYHDGKWVMFEPAEGKVTGLTGCRTVRKIQAGGRKWNLS